MKFFKIKKHINSVVIFGLFLQFAAPLHSITTDERDILLALDQEPIIDLAEHHECAEMIIEMVDQAFSLGLQDYLDQKIVDCYFRIQDGDTVFASEELMEIMPHLFRYSLSHRAPRQTDIDTSNAFVGNANGCDLVPVLSLLTAIKSKIGSVKDSSCCNTILGVLGDACTILGPNESISSKLKQICDTLNSSTVVITGTIDFSAIFTAIEELQEVTFQKFEQTWTILQEITVDVEIGFDGTFTAIEALQEVTCDKFDQTWTILDGLNLTVTADLSGVFTAIEALQEVTCDKFEQTWTILADLTMEVEVNLDSVFTAIQELQEVTCDKFEETWTILQEITTDIEIGFDGTFTVIEALQEVTCQKFEETWTILQEIEFKEDQIIQQQFETFTAIAGLQEITCHKFEQTWTILADLSLSTTTDFSAIFTVLGNACDFVENPTFTQELCTIFGFPVEVDRSIDLPDFVLDGLGGSCFDLDVDLDLAFDDINESKASIIEWLKRIYILVRNLVNDNRAGILGSNTSINL